MNQINKKKGFTLIELLAVIVILAIIILIAATNIGGLTNTAKKNVLAEEGNNLVNSAKLAYPEALMNGEIDEDVDDFCFDLEELYKKGFFDKGSKDKYYGSVLIKKNTNDENYNYTFWISNGSYKIENEKFGATGKKAQADSSNASSNCGGFIPTKPSDPDNPNPGDKPDIPEVVVPELVINVDKSKLKSNQVLIVGTDDILAINMTNEEIINSLVFIGGTGYIMNGDTIKTITDNHINGKTYDIVSIITKPPSSINRYDEMLYSDEYNIYGGNPTIEEFLNSFTINGGHVLCTLQGLYFPNGSFANNHIDQIEIWSNANDNGSGKLLKIIKLTYLH